MKEKGENRHIAGLIHRRHIANPLTGVLPVLQAAAFDKLLLEQVNSRPHDF
jgi:hypothetical protein